MASFLGKGGKCSGIDGRLCASLSEWTTRGDIEYPVVVIVVVVVGRRKER